MDHQYPKVAKIPVLDTRKFEQWQFRIQQYLQHEHYALWEVIEFGDSYKVPTTTDPNNTTTRKDDEQSGRTVTIITEDMQRKKNDVKARTTLLLSLPDEHQLRFSKYKTAKELWAAILKTFGGYEAKVQKKSNPNSQNMAFISSLKYSSGDEDGNTACVSTSSTTFPTASASVATISQDTASAYIASPSNGSQIKFEDINQINEDDIEEMDIKWSMALLSMRADKFWKKTGKKISIQGSDVAGFDKSKVECFNCHKMGHFARECRAPRREDHALVADAEAPIEFSLMVNTEGMVFDNSLCLNDCKKSNDSLNSPEFVLKKKACFSCGDFSHLANECRKRVQRETTRSQNLAYMGPSHRSAGHRPHGAPIRPPHRSAGHRPHGASMRPSHRPAGHRPHGPSMNPIRPNMNGARPNRSFFIQALSYETRPFLKSSAVKTQYRAPWVPTVNRNNPPVKRKFSNGRRNFPTVNRKFPTASRKFTTGSTKIHTADMGRKAKANNIDDKGYWDSGYSRHMTDNISYLSDLSHLMEDMCLLVKEDARLQAKEPFKPINLSLRMYIL
uniref:CCHC-type domain-containing protein n=1 Tax=Tanacetum cinerariifolium TaxID=118510 RepID=A0A6L2LXU3_TANCI|nr:hypothetical protein [Tanacetum cinerariifolium]